MHSIPLCIGLTGGIGCGKSTVARLFSARGALVIDTDAIAHQLTQPGSQAIQPIIASFGQDYITPTGALNRSKMRRLIFSDANARSNLEKILHPMILARCREQLATPSDAPYSLLMAPLLLECPDFLALVERVLLVDCSEQNQIAHVMQRSGLDETEIRAIIGSQMSGEERLVHADDVIRNDGTVDELTDQVASLHERYISNKHLTAS